MTSPRNLTVVGTVTGGTSLTPEPPRKTPSQLAREAAEATRRHSRQALDDALLHIAESAARAADVSELPSLPPGVTEDLARLAEHTAAVLQRVHATMRRVG